MDCSNTQYNSMPRRPQMPPPPFMHMNYECSSGMKPSNIGSSCIQCQNQKPFDMPIGMGYVPIQRWMQTYATDQALKKGTIFPELDYPFLAGRCCR